LSKEKQPGGDGIVSKLRQKRHNLAFDWWKVQRGRKGIRVGGVCRDYCRSIRWGGSRVLRGVLFGSFWGKVWGEEVGLEKKSKPKNNEKKKTTSNLV